MNIFNKFFGRSEVLLLPGNFFRPRINKGQFFLMEDSYNLLEIQVEGIVEFIRKNNSSLSNLNRYQKSLYCLIEQIRNNMGDFGFYHFFEFSQENLEIFGAGESSDLKQVLNQFKLNKLSQSLEGAYRYYYKNEKKLKLHFNNEQELSEDEFDSFQNDLSDYSDLFDEGFDEAMLVLGNFLKGNVELFFVDENGSEFTSKYTGLCKTFHKETGSIKQEFEMKNGMLDGYYKFYGHDGVLIEKKMYRQGELN